MKLTIKHRYFGYKGREYFDIEVEGMGMFYGLWSSGKYLNEPSYKDKESDTWKKHYEFDKDMRAHILKAYDGDTGEPSQEVKHNLVKQACIALQDAAGGGIEELRRVFKEITERPEYIALDVGSKARVAIHDEAKKLKKQVEYAKENPLPFD